MRAFPSALPRARTPEPMDAPPLRWGILGTGWIAQRFAASLTASTRQQVHAVGSRSPTTARAFADTIGAGTAYGSYAELVGDPRVDVVYVATPHPLHHPHARLAIDAGKPVVVEKPLSLNAGEARDLAARAGARGVFLMEAMWTLFLPKYDVIRQLLADGVLGDVQTVIADMGEQFEPDHRIMRADLAGGPMLDLGTYPVMLATWVLGTPSEVVATASPAPNGVNGQVAAALRTPSGALASLHTSLLGATPTTAVIAGSHGSLVIDGPFYQPGAFTLLGRSGERLRHQEAAISHGALHFEAAEAARRIVAGDLGSPLRPPADSVATLETMDAIRREVGIVFDDEVCAPPPRTQSSG